MQTVEELKEENEKLKKEILFLKDKMRKYVPSFGELIDRCVIVQMKELLIPEHRETYSQEIKEIIHDLDSIIKENGLMLDGETIRNIILLTVYNREIWLSESAARKSGDLSNVDLAKSHMLNGLRTTAKNKIQNKIGGRTDLKVDYIEPSSTWIPSW